MVEYLAENVNILVFADNNASKWRETFREKEIVCPAKVKEFSYDYIVIASQFNEEIYKQLLDMNVNKEIIFQYIKFLDIMWNPFEYKLSLFNRNIDKIETIVTGISYAMSGVKDSLLKK